MIQIKSVGLKLTVKKFDLNIELSNFAAAIGAGAKFLSEQNAGFPFSIKKGGYYN